MIYIMQFFNPGSRRMLLYSKPLSFNWRIPYSGHHRYSTINFIRSRWKLFRRPSIRLSTFILRWKFISLNDSWRITHHHLETISSESTSILFYLFFSWRYLNWRSLLMFITRLICIGILFFNNISNIQVITLFKTLITFLTLQGVSIIIFINMLSSLLDHPIVLPIHILTSLIYKIFEKLSQVVVIGTISKFQFSTII